MDRESFEKQKLFAGEKRASMQRRCLDHDYTQPCMYMITMTTEGRRPLFGVVKGRADASPQGTSGFHVSDIPHIEPSPLGEAVTAEWNNIPSYYPQIKLIAFQLMPDHLHAILWVREPLPCHLSRVLSGFKTGCHRQYRITVAPIITASTALPSTY